MLSNLEPSHTWDLDISFMIGTPGNRNALNINIDLGTFPINKRILDRTIRTEYQETSGMQAGGNHSHGVPGAGGEEMAMLCARFWKNLPAGDILAERRFVARDRRISGTSRSRQARTARGFCHCPRPKGPRDSSMTSEGGIHERSLTAAVSKPWEISLVARG